MTMIGAFLRLMPVCALGVAVSLRLRWQVSESLVAMSASFRPHCGQNFTLSGFSVWQVEQFIPSRVACLGQESAENSLTVA